MTKTITIFFCVMLLFSSLLAQNSSQKISLEESLNYALANSPLVKKGLIEIEKSKTTKQQVEAMRILPEISFAFRTGVVPEARGDVFYSPDKQTDLNGWGPFFQTEIKFLQPLYTFGRIDAAANAADNMIEVEKYKQQISINSFSLNVVQAYWAVLSSNKAITLANDLKKAFDSLLVKIDEEIKKEDSELDQSYMFEAKSNSYVIETLYKNSQSNKIIAQKTFSELVGMNIEDSKLEFAEESSPQFTESLNLDDALRVALLNQNEIKAVQSGIEAINSKIQFEKKQRLPLIYLAGGVAYGYAGNRDDQKNPFVYDQFNYINLAAFVGVNFNLNFFSKNIEAEKWSLEKTNMESNLGLLESKTKVEVTKAFYEAKNNYELMKEVQKSLDAAQSWVAMSYDNWEQGLGEPERLIKAMNTYFQVKAQALEKEFMYNISLAKLANSIGRINYYMDWLKHEKINFN